MFVKILGPGDAPDDLLDWQKIHELLQATWLRLNVPLIVDGAYVKRGSAVCMGGQWYVCTLDEAITGTASDYVKLTVSGSTIVAAFASSLSGVSWNHQWSGWYNVTGSYFHFDEIKAFSVGSIDRIYSPERWSPSLNWTKALNRTLSNSNLARLFHPTSRQTLTGTGTYTVGSGVYQLTIRQVGPGSDGQPGSQNEGGDGGASGEELNYDLAVTPGQEIAYAVTSDSTIFGSTTALKGAGYPGQTGGSGAQYAAGGSGGGYKAGKGGKGISGSPTAAVAGYGGGGGGGRAAVMAASPGAAGATGRIEIS